jgi:hypothetical protein
MRWTSQSSTRVPFLNRSETVTMNFVLFTLLPPALSSNALITGRIFIEENSFFDLTPTRFRRMMALVPRGSKDSEPSGK